MEEEKKNLHRVKFLDYKLQNGVTYYSISVTTLANSESWIFESRYRYMLELHNQIAASSEAKLPTFPPKKWPGNTNPDFISQRQKSLENYFNNLLKVVNIEKIPLLKQFLYQSYKKKKEQNDNSDPPPAEIPKKEIPLPKKIKEEDKEPPINTFSMKTQFEKIVESSKFVDLIDAIVSPEEDEVKEKKEKFRTLNYNLKITLPKKEPLPESKMDNLSEDIIKPTILKKNSDLIQVINYAMDNLMAHLGNADELTLHSQIIHCFQS